MIDRIIRAVRRAPGDRDAEAVQHITRKLFARHVPEEFSRQQSVNLATMLGWVYDFCRERIPGESKLRVLEPAKEREGWTMPFGLVAILTEDRPFLVDSLTMAIAESELTVQFVFHPQLHAERDAQGRLRRFCDSRGGDGETVAESLMLFWIERPIPEEVIRDLSERIDTALIDVESAVADWQAMRSRVEELTEQLDQPSDILPDADREEAGAFLRWLSHNHFTFLGYREYDVVEEAGDRVLRLRPESGLGILRQSRKQGRRRSVTALERRLRDFSDGPIPLIFTKTDARSTVHRRGHMDYIGVLRHDADGHIIGESRFIGLYTSTTYHRSAWEIPFIRSKADAVMAQSGLTPDSHGGKALGNILETLPRDELFQSTIDELYNLSMGVLDLEARARTRLFIRRDHVAQFYSCMVFIPRERFNTESRQRVQQVLREELGGVRDDFTLQLGESDLVRIHLIVRPEGECSEHFDVEAIEQRVVEAVRSWSDDLREILLERMGDQEGLRLYRRFEPALPPAYVDQVAPTDAAFDIEKLDRLAGPNDIAMSLYAPPEPTRGLVRFKVFKHDHTIPLSEALPMLEHMGLRAVTERPYELRMPDGLRIWIQDFDLAPTFTEALDIAQVREPFQETFEHVWRGHAESDGFNRLILAAHMTWRQAVLLRACCKYLLQTGVPFSQQYMEDTLSRYPFVARLLVEFFEARFDPTRDGEKKRAREKAAAVLGQRLGVLAGDDERSAEAVASLVNARMVGRDAQMTACRELLDTLLDAVSSLDEERILRGFSGVIDATVRTNFYQAAADGPHHDYIAFKIASARVSDLPKPRPYYEIFVYSPTVEGIHLRGGMVARGGLRWSDRREDFRTEVLGLLKAQSVKNTMIVPVGAKGGFVVKQPPEEGGREALQKAGIACYQRFIHGLLDVTDNLVQGELVHPDKVVRHDEPDPYLVVAADKGTATFSDIANDVSAQHNFWMGDAFASGGSNGYDHKKMGITAKGGWESVKRHFRELGTDCQREPFTVVGIGDMAGDVFGNGMLLSEQIRLVAAFNHLHIFIDPDPDPATSYQERQRLFQQAGGWDQYDTDLISRGGGVWSRTAKRIDLSKAARDALGIEDKALAPNELIRAILCAPVDLLWNGGIGTYVKGTEERDDSVGDRANRLLRINGAELRCRVVGEGGNLGFTQAGRVEFALRGGYINTDFIDNSAGVDCSDHEVNIKILLNAAVAAGELTDKKRNNLLGKMTDEVGQLVLRNNYLQTQAISMMSAFAVRRLGTKAHLINWLESRGIMDRRLEDLPDEEGIQERRAQGLGLTRPELAVLLSYAKITLYPELLASDVPEDAYLSRELAMYFPTPLRERFAKHMHNHRLWREIIATQVTNSVINRMGASFVMRMQEDTGASSPEVARAYTIAREVLDARSLWQEIEGLDNQVVSEVQSRMLLTIWGLLRHLTRRLLARPGHALDIQAAVDAYGPGFRVLWDQLADLEIEHEFAQIEAAAATLVEQSVPQALATRIARLDALYPAFDIIDIANAQGRKVEQVGRVYARLGEDFRLRWMRAQIETLAVDGTWHASARGSLRDGLYQQHAALTVRVLQAQRKKPADEAVDQWCADHERDVQRVRALMADMQRMSRLDYPTAIVALRAMEQLVLDCVA